MKRTSLGIAALICLLILSIYRQCPAQAYQQLLDACPGCSVTPIAVPKPTCVDCEAQSQSDAPAVQSISSYNADLSGVYARAGYQENDKGVAAYNARNWDKAIAHFKKALKFLPGNATFRTNLDNAIAQRDDAANAAAREAAAAAARAEYQRKLDEYNRAVAEKNEANQLTLKLLNENVATRAAQLKKLEDEISKVPPLSVDAPRKVIHEGVMLGLYNTQEHNSVNKLTSPWSKQPYDATQIFATSNDTSNLELLRGLIDNNYLGEYTLNTAYGRQLIERLRGTHFDRLVAHSNGATIAEALIRRGIITVNELNVMGGDRSFVNFGGWNELISSGKVARVVVWVNPGDPVPWGTSILPLLNKYSPRSEYAHNLAAFAMDKVMGSKGGHNAEYRWLKGDGYEGQEWQFNKQIFRAHDAEVYNRNVARDLDRPASGGH